MNWIACGPKRLAHEVEALARGLGIEFGGNLARQAGDPPIAPGCDGVVFHGSDHDLARFAPSTSVPIAFAPSQPSDLMRMFGHGNTDVRSLIDSGSAYPTDLGHADSDAGRHSFVAHALASASGRLPRASSPAGRIVLDRGGRTISRRALAVLIMNAQHVDGATLAPRAALMDGVADIQVVAASIGERVGFRRRARRGLHTGSAGVHRRTGPLVQLQLPGHWWLAVDGIRVPGKCWTIRIERAAFTLWV